MDSSDDEAEKRPELVSNYYFLDHDDEPISFSVLPLLWNEQDSVNPHEDSSGPKGGVFLHGSADKGLKAIYREVQAWKIDLNNVSAEISVLSKDNCWFKLQKPRKSYEGTIRNVLITVNCLHYLKRNPESSAKSLWDYMAKAFRLYEVRPGAKDLANHTSLVKEAIKKDDSLAKCKFLTTFLEGKQWMRKQSSEGVQSTSKPGFIVEDDEMEVVEDDPDAEDDEDVFDSVCAICDNGGELLCCEGRCMRSFHATAEAGEDSTCESLGLTNAEVEAIQQFLCKNCEYKQHQCFVCGKLGSSDKSSGAEVFACVSATCSRFYHPHCVAKLLHPKDADAAKELQKNIAGGKSFTCPSHKCCVCGKGENKKMPELQFAVCRRCPRSYHRKCLPKEIAFEDTEDEETRAWEDLLLNRILIYCLKHELDQGLGTPVRDHLKFPHVEEKKTAISGKRKKPTRELPAGIEKKVAEKSPASDEYLSRTPRKTSDQKERLSSLANGSLKSKRAKVSTEQEIPKKAKVTNASGQSSKDNKKLGSLAGGNSSAAKEKEDTVSLGERLFSLYMEGSETEQVDAVKQDKTLASETTLKKLDSSLPPLDADSERRIRDIIKDATSSVSMQDVLEKQKLPSTHTQSLKSNVDKAITMGKLEGAVEAVRTALQKIEEGGSIEDAQAVCDPDVLSQLFKWKDKLKVYLSPFIFGMRYTSFGRHFTKVDKLEEIADKLHWYVENGDTIVDFCCGANDFSCLLEKKLKETGKKCSYKNYDLFPAKNTFNFEKRDWMTVSPKELPAGNKLIMGLNPPFGVNAALANKFIDKALEFKPKLLILIVPPETQRLDKKKFAYDLVWEDDNFLSGKSFYLPGSVDESDKQMDQWNLNAPLLYLWSHPKWTSKHKAVAQRQGHLEDKSNATEFPDYSGADRSKQGGVPSVSNGDILRQNERAEETKESKVVTEGQNGSFSLGNSRKDGPENQESQSPEDSRKRQCDKMAMEISRPSPRETNARSPFSVQSRNSSDMSLAANIGGSNHQSHVENLHPEFEEDYTLGLDNIIEDIGRTYGLNNDEYLVSERLSNSLSPHPEYRARNLEEPHMGHLRERPDGYGSSSTTEADERYWRELDMRTQARPTSSTYGPVASPLTELSYRMTTSTMQRYAPRLDELNPPRMGSGVGPDPLGMSRPGPSRMGGGGGPDPVGMSRPEPSRMGSGGGPDPRGVSTLGFRDLRAPHPGEYHGHQQGFASGPYNPFSHTNSSGWLNE
ncbi:protein ENHANCED DOWNY MILDEW 2-like isoform X2 [Punica granatum]|uniref:Protein ENHANCED DOWNY MILDEW 2-like isoform X2 n=1 Tax=Punica granatum TaxID=22663 RepID=A0A6P8BYS4_PUNGR|nr:protein ENHANCED DOWNY MILDEW 2-like isoform X2 [Punica granatum]